MSVNGFELDANGDYVDAAPRADAGRTRRDSAEVQEQYGPQETETAKVTMTEAETVPAPSLKRKRSSTAIAEGSGMPRNTASGLETAASTAPTQQSVLSGPAAHGHNQSATAQLKSYLVKLEDGGEIVNVLLQVRHYAITARMFADEGVSDVAWPDLARYSMVHVAMSQPLEGFWDLGGVKEALGSTATADDIIVALENISKAGAGLCATIQGQQQDQDTFVQLQKLHELATLIFLPSKPYNIFSALWDADNLSIPKSWVETTTKLVVDFMQAVVDADPGCHDLPPITGSKLDRLVREQIYSRFLATMDRTLGWRRNLASKNTKGLLIDSFIDYESDMKRLSNFATQIAQGGSITGWPNHHFGFTEYRGKGCESVAPDFERTFVNLLPRVNIPPTPKVSTTDNDTSARPELSASTVYGEAMRLYTPRLISLYATLRALLRACGQNDNPAPGPRKHDIVALNGTHVSPMSVLIFKSAWLVIASAEELWCGILEREEKGHFTQRWAQEQKPALKHHLGAMTRFAVDAQLDAKREEVRLRNVEPGMPEYYW